MLRHGKPIAERHYNGTTPEELIDIRFAEKSVTALLVDVAVDRGAIRSIADPVARYWPAAAGSAIGAVPLREVLSGVQRRRRWTPEEKVRIVEETYLRA